MGMVMTCQPIFDCFDAVKSNVSEGASVKVIYMSPKGKTLTQKRCIELSQMDSLFILCGHYEGVDERVLEEIVDEEISIGDYVLTGGEIPACILVDCVSRLIDGVLAAPECYESESIACGLLEYPQYTRPAEWMGKAVPEVLLSGNHKNIENWRRCKSLILTMEKRPDMLKESDLTDKDKKLLKKLENITMNLCVIIASYIFYAISYSCGMNLHLKIVDGINNHHMAEALFKAFGKAIDMAVAKEPRIKDVWSTKGSL